MSGGSGLSPATIWLPARAGLRSAFIPHSSKSEIRNLACSNRCLHLLPKSAADHEVVKIAGVCGKRQQAMAEAELALRLGYDAALLSLGSSARRKRASVTGALPARSPSVIPVIGFYLQPAAGGRLLSYDSGGQFAEIENVVAIKMAPFNRYQTLDVVRAVAESGRTDEIALYTGNDDNILARPAHHLRFRRRASPVLRWACSAIGPYGRRQPSSILREAKQRRNRIPARFLTLAQQITDANAALFDPAHHFHGCIPGIHEILRRQGLLEGRWCLDPAEELSPRQSEEIDRVCTAYPHLLDDQFVKEHLDEWLR